MVACGCCVVRRCGCCYCVLCDFARSRAETQSHAKKMQQEDGKKKDKGENPFSFFNFMQSHDSKPSSSPSLPEKDKNKLPTSNTTTTSTSKTPLPTSGSLNLPPFGDDGEDTDDDLESSSSDDGMILIDITRREGRREREGEQNSLSSYRFPSPSSSHLRRPSTPPAPLQTTSHPPRSPHTPNTHLTPPAHSSHIFHPTQHFH
jgi:hypothetical protein